VTLRSQLLSECLALGLICAATARAGMPPPTWPAAARPVTVATEPVGQVTVGPLQVELGRTTFDDVQNALGFSPIQVQGDAGNAERWVCYTIPRLSARVWLRSSGPAGANQVNGLSAQRVGLKSTATEECPNVILRDNRVITDSGVELGSPLRNLSSRFAAVDASREAMVSYAFAGRDDGSNVGSNLTMKVAAGKVVEFHVTHTVTR
jgi:hypothetical protein